MVLTLKEAVLADSAYTLVRFDDDDVADMCQEFVELSKQVESAFKLPGLMSALTSDMHRASLSSICSSLDVNMKSHKSKGEVKVRAIHATSASPFKPAMLFISSCIRSSLSS